MLLCFSSFGALGVYGKRQQLPQWHPATGALANTAFVSARELLQTVDCWLTWLKKTNCAACHRRQLKREGQFLIKQ